MASSSVMETLSNELSAAAEKAGGSVVGIHGQHRMTASGIQWRKGIIMTVDHGTPREDSVRIILGPDESVTATVAGRDSSTDLAVLKTEQAEGLGIPDFSDSSSLKLGHLVLALGRSWRGNLVASAGIVGGLSGELRTRRGGRLDQHVRLDLNLYPGLSGGPLLTTQGKVAGINTGGLSRGRAVTIPVVTVNRVVDELLEKGHIARPYLGLAMQPVGIPETMRSKLKPETATGVLVVHVEPGGPAEKAGVLLGDVLTEVQSKPLEDVDQIQELLLSAKIGDTFTATAIRGGAVTQLSIKLEDRPAR